MRELRDSRLREVRAVETIDLDGAHKTPPPRRHAVAAGLDAPVTVEIDGHVGYYCAGMNKQATVIIHGNAGVGVAENMMSGWCT